METVPSTETLFSLAWTAAGLFDDDESRRRPENKKKKTKKKALTFPASYYNDRAIKLRDDFFPSSSSSYPPLRVTKPHAIARVHNYVVGPESR